MEKILISACFLGENVRYNGKIKTLFHPIIEQWKKQNRLIAVCPETVGGLATPRPPAEQQANGLIITTTAQNVTSAFHLGAQHALSLCKQHQIKYALLKESSPSCGSSFIYDGSFSNKKINGQGVTTKLLREHNIIVFSEHNIEQLASLIIAP